ncbi:MAG: site-2 protease family protein [Solirubrobacterales bacterium]|nr:site-2 protease family protein [Solirubrobacterales bacterium]
MPFFRAWGIQVSVDWSWLLALGYVMFVMVDDYQQLLGPEQRNLAFAYGVGVAFAFFASIVLHEFGHAIVARRNNIGILGIELWLLGGLAKMDRDPESPGVEFRVSAAGPAVTLALAIGLLGAAYGLNPGPTSELEPLQITAGQQPWIVALTTLGWINVFLLFFNLIPAYPLDGGRIARSIIWKITGNEQRATKISATLGTYFGYVLVGLGVLLIFRAPLSGFLFIFMGWTLAQSARGASMQNSVLGEARDLRVADVMDRQPVVIPAEATVQDALDEYFWRYRWPWFPVVDQSGRFIGLIEQHSVDRISEDARTATIVNGLIAPHSTSERSVRDDTPLTALLANEQIRDYGSLMAIDSDGLLSGVITIEQVQRALRDAIARATQTSEPPAASPQN